MKRLFVAAILCFILSCEREGRLPDMTETFGYSEHKPFGASVMYDLSSLVFYGNHEISNTSIHQIYLTNEDSAAVYISISKYLDLSENDIESLMLFASAGNTAIIASGEIDSLLQKAVGMKQISPDLPRTFEDGRVSLKKEYDTSGKRYSFFHKRFSSYFLADTSRVKVLGFNSEGRANALSFEREGGRIILFSDPRVFSNYFILSNDNYLYLRNIFRLLPYPTSKWYWDNYYSKLKKQSEGGGSTLSEILRYPSLAAAFWIGVLLLLLFILFNSKRRRAVIQVQEQKMTPASFMETITELYIHTAENRVIGQKMVVRLHDHITRKWFIQNMSEMPVEKFSAKTGVEQQDIAELFSIIKRINQEEEISDADLIRLEQIIQMFYK